MKKKNNPSKFSYDFWAGSHINYNPIYADIIMSVLKKIMSAYKEDLNQLCVSINKDALLLKEVQNLFNSDSGSDIFKDMIVPDLMQMAISDKNGNCEVRMPLFERISCGGDYLVFTINQAIRRYGIFADFVNDITFEEEKSVDPEFSEALKNMTLSDFEKCVELIKEEQ